MAKKIPEWEIFNRVESLEKLRLTVDDLNKVAVTTFFLSFMSLVARNPSEARWFKDKVIALLKEQGVTTDTLNSLEPIMLQICETWEKRLKG